MVFNLDEQGWYSLLWVVQIDRSSFNPHFCWVVTIQCDNGGVMSKVANWEEYPPYASTEYPPSLPQLQVSISESCPVMQMVQHSCQGVLSQLFLKIQFGQNFWLQQSQINELQSQSVSCLGVWPLNRGLSFVKNFNFMFDWKVRSAVMKTSLERLKWRSK